MNYEDPMDGLQREIQLPPKNKLKGLYQIYYLKDQQWRKPPKHCQNYENAVVGDWILSDDEVIAQVLEIYTNRRRVVSVVTAFGVDPIRNPTGARVPLKLLRPRKAFYSYSPYPKGHQSKHLSTDEKLILYNLVLLKNWTEAYERATGKKITAATKYYARMKIKKALNHPKAIDFMNTSIAEITRKYGVNSDWWVQKLIDAVGKKPMTTPTQLNAHILLGKLIPDVRKELEGTGDDGDTKSSFQLPQAQEANYTDVCKVCNDTKVLSTRDTSGQSVKIPCPTCTRQVKTQNEESKTPKLQIS